MSSKHVTKKFLQWQEGLLNNQEKIRVEEHLKGCHSCQSYYDTWMEILENPDKNSLPQLEADPFLPTRIMSGEIKDTAEDAKKPATVGIRWSFATALAIIGLSTGAILGFTTSDPDQYTEQEIASAYYKVFTQQENQYNMEQLLGLENGGENED